MKLGIDGKLYYNTSEDADPYANPEWTEIDNVRDLSLNNEAAEADVTTRRNAGWEAVAAVLLKNSIEWGMVYDLDDEAYVALQDAFLARTTIELLILDGDIEAVGQHDGLRATYSVFKFGRSEKNTEAMITEVSVKPAYNANPPEAFTVTVAP